MGRFSRDPTPIRISFRLGDLSAKHHYVVRNDRSGLVSILKQRGDWYEGPTNEFIKYTGWKHKEYKDVHFIGEWYHGKLTTWMDAPEGHPVWKPYLDIEKEGNMYVQVGLLMKMYPHKIKGDFARQYARLKQYINAGKDIDVEYYHIVNDMIWTTSTIKDLVDEYKDMHQINNYVSGDIYQVRHLPFNNGNEYRKKLQFDLYNYARGRISAKLLRNKIIKKPITPMEWKNEYEEERWRFRKGSKCINSPHMDFIYNTHLPYHKVDRIKEYQLNKYNQSLHGLSAGRSGEAGRLFSPISWTLR